MGDPALFKQQNSGHSLLKSDFYHIGMCKCVMAWIKEISENLQKTVVDAHQIEELQNYIQRV